MKALPYCIVYMSVGSFMIWAVFSIIYSNIKIPIQSNLCSNFLHRDVGFWHDFVHPPYIYNNIYYLCCELCYPLSLIRFRWSTISLFRSLKGSIEKGNWLFPSVPDTKSQVCEPDKLWVKYPIVFPEPMAYRQLHGADARDKSSEETEQVLERSSNFSMHFLLCNLIWNVIFFVFNHILLV